MKKITFFLTMMLSLIGTQTTQAIQPMVYTIFYPESGELTYYYNIYYAEHPRSPYVEFYDPVANPQPVRFTDYNDKVFRVIIDSSMKDAPLTSTSYMFYGGYNSAKEQSQPLSSMKTIRGLEYLNTTDVTDMSYMFCGCSSLESLDVSGLNTSNVETMRCMFSSYYNLTSLNLSSFNTAKVTDMKEMFYLCRKFETLDLTPFNIVSVTDMQAMFQGCQELTTIWSNDYWGLTSAQSADMFGDCTKLVGGQGTTFNRDFVDATYAHPDGGKVFPGYFTRKEEVYTEFVEETGTLTYYYDLQRMQRTGETELYNPIKYPEAIRFANYFQKVTKVVIDPSMKEAPLTSFRNMSYGGMDSKTFTLYLLQNVTSIEGLENLNTSIVTDMNSMFIMYTSLTSLDLSSFNTSKVTNMNGMFLGCEKLQTLDLTSFDVSNVTDMRMMFGSCSELTTIYCDKNWNHISHEASYIMFSGCKKLVGGQGTLWDDDNIDATYARPDGGPVNPGYFTESPSPQGDLNGDKKVDIADAVCVLNEMADGGFNPAADLNGDVKVDIADFVTVLNIMSQQ